MTTDMAEIVADFKQFITAELSHQTLEITERLGGVETRLGSVETSLDGVEARLDGVETRLGRVETDLTEFREYAEQGFAMIMSSVGIDVEDHEKRLRRLEAKAWH